MDIVSIKNSIKDTWIDWIQLFLIGLTAPFFLFPSIKYAWILLIVPGIWICRWIVLKHFFEKTVLDWAIVVLFIQVFATCIIVPDLGLSLSKIAGVLFGLAFFYSIVALLKSEELIKLGILIFLLASLMLSSIGILGIKWDKDEVFFNHIINNIDEIIPKLNLHLPGAEEGFNSNAIGGILILIIPLCLILFITYLKRKKENYLISYKLFSLITFSLILLLICSVLFLTLSFGSWIGLIISIWILLLSPKWKAWSSLLILLLIMIISIYLFSTYKADVSIQKDVNYDIPTVNKYYLVEGTDLVQNGGFESGTDGWNPYTNTQLASVSGGKFGKCLRITKGKTAFSFVIQDLPIKAGKTYKLSFYVKRGIESSCRVRLRDLTNKSNILRLTMYVGANWEQFIYPFKAPDGCARIQIRFQINAAFGLGQNLYFDEISLREITPIGKEEDNKDFYKWIKNTQNNIYRRYSGSNIKVMIKKLKNQIEKREALWGIGIRTINRLPLFGIGMNRIRQLPTVGYERSHVHNHLLHTAAELGIPGLLAYLAILIGAGFMCIEVWRKSNIGWMKMTTLGLGCGQLAHFIFGMADSIPLGAKVGIFFWISLGLISAIYNYIVRKNIYSGRS